MGSLRIGFGSAPAYPASHVLCTAGVREWNERCLGVEIGALGGFAVTRIASQRQLAGYAQQLGPNLHARAHNAVDLMRFITQAQVIASMKFIPASMAALISMGTPLMAVPVGYVFRRKQKTPNLTALAEICIALAGLLLAVWHCRPEPLLVAFFFSFETVETP